MWYLVEIGGEYYAEKKIETPTGRKKKILFRDFNGDVLGLTNDKKFAQDWVDARNDIEDII